MTSVTLSCPSRVRVIGRIVDARGPAGNVIYRSRLSLDGRSYEARIGIDPYSDRRSVGLVFDPEPADRTPLIEALATRLRLQAIERQQRGDDRAARDREAAERLRLAMQRAPVRVAAEVG